jgi:hypothetical protein
MVMEIMTRGKCDLLSVLGTVPVLLDALSTHSADPIVKPSRAEASVLCKVLGSLRTIFMKLVQIFLDLMELKC